ncbi:hypothetical protein CWB89_23680, partial [Pseudoalteromonas piscicida]
VALGVVQPFVIIEKALPHQRHTGQDEEILAQRKERMEIAKAANPGRWGTRAVRNCSPVGPTTLNPEKQHTGEVKKQAA